MLDTCSVYLVARIVCVALSVRRRKTWNPDAGKRLVCKSLVVYLLSCASGLCELISRPTSMTGNATYPISY